MSRTPRLVLTGLFAAFMATAGWSATGNVRTQSAMSRIWAVNIGSEAIEVGVEREQGSSIQRETLTIAPGDSVEVRRTADETLGVAHQRDLLLVTAGWDFDPATLVIEGLPKRVERSVAEARGREGSAAAATAAQAGDGTRVKNGSVVSSPILWMGSEPRTLSLGLGGEKSWRGADQEARRESWPPTR